MASENDDVVTVYFVETPGGSQNVSSTSQGSNKATITAAAVPVRSAIMKTALKSIKRRKLTPKWIDPSKVQQTCEALSATAAGGGWEEIEAGSTTNSSTSATVNKKNEIMFVLDAFEGPVYEYLSKNNYRIISPYVIKYCDDDCPEPFETIPLRAHPLFSQCMRNIIVTATSLPTETRKALEAKVMKMCGNYSSGLNHTVKVLIAGSVLTDKYKAAARLSIPVVRPDWVENCWTTYQYNFVRADSPELLRRYALPIFHNLMITCSGIETNQRAKVKDLIEKNGGTYSPTLRFDVLNTVLVLNQPVGDKYRYAKKKNIPRLRVEWLYESVSANYALPMENFNIDCGDVSVAAVDETLMPLSTVNKENLGNKSSSSTTSNTTRVRNNLSNLHGLADLLDELVLSGTADKNFFDNKVILAAGFDDVSTMAIKNSVRLCGAFFVTDFRPMVTHVIVGPSFSSTQPLWERLQEANIDKVVTIDWLISSLKASECVDYLPHRYNPSQSSAISSSVMLESGASNGKNFNIGGTTPSTNRSRLDLFSTQAENMIQMFSEPQKEVDCNNTTSTLIAATPVTTTSTNGVTNRKKKKVADEDEGTTSKTTKTRATSPTPSQTTRSTKTTKSSRQLTSTQNFRSLTGVDSDDDEPVIWSPNSKPKAKVRLDEDDEPAAASQRSTNKQIISLRSASTRLKKQFAESDDEGEKSLSPIRSSRKRTLPVINLSDNDDSATEEENEKDDSCVEILDTNDIATNKIVSRSNASEEPTLNLLQKKPSSTTPSTSVGILSTQPSTSVGILSTNEKKNRDLNSMEGSLDDDDNLGDSIDDYIEDEEEMEGMTADTADEEDEVNENTEDSDDDEEKDTSQKSNTPRKPLFMFSGFDSDVREEMIAKTKSILGVEVHEDDTVLPTVTHLILREPFATEKSLSAIAGGAWIIVPDFIHRSLEAGRLLPEDEFEWSAQDISAYSDSSSRRRLMLAATAWRRHFAERGTVGAFAGWDVLVLNKSGQMDSMFKILAAGRAKVYDLETCIRPFEDIIALDRFMKYALFDRNGFLNGTASSGRTPLALYPNNLTREQFVKVLEIFASKGKLIRQETLSRYLLAAKPDDVEHDGFGGEESVLIKKDAITSSQLKTMLKEKLRK